MPEPGAASAAAPPAIAIAGVAKSFGAVAALSGITAQVAPGCLTGLVGPDGAGKTTLMRLLAGLLQPTAGRITVAGCDTVRDADRLALSVGYMPQRFGLYEDLSVQENLRLYAGLHGLAGAEQRPRFERLLAFTRLAPFAGRLAGDLSGGMKQKLGLACALMAQPRVLLLDEPSVGVDPVSRQELWRMVGELAGEGVAVLWATSYLDEAERCASVLLLSDGALAYAGPPEPFAARLAGRSFLLRLPQGDRRRVLLRVRALPAVRDGVIQGAALRVVLDRDAGTQTRAALAALAADAGGELAPVAPRFEDAFVDFLGGGPSATSVLAERMPPVAAGADVAGGADVAARADVAVECRNLTKRFGSFAATDDVSFAVRRGEIFGLLGPNGAGKSTTFRMLCGLLRPTSGSARVVGLDLRTATSAAKLQLGYMAQKFSLYGLLSVGQNLAFSAGVYGLAGAVKRARIDEMVETFQLGRYLATSPDALPLGYKQRLALACALMHRPPVLFLDEPTSGVDPLTRREFWTHINGLVLKGVTVLVTTHFMEEAEYCDRVALMYRAKVIALDTPDALKRAARGAETPHEPPGPGAGAAEWGSEAEPVRGSGGGAATRDKPPGPGAGADEPTMEQAFVALVEPFDAAERAPAVEKAA